MTGAVRRLAPAAWPALWFIALAIVFTWPLALTPASRLAALHGPGDPYLNLWILGWDLQTISESPASLFNGRVFDANIFHPARQTLTYSDNFLLQAIAVWPVYALTGSAVLCYNLVFAGSLVASALAMFALVRGVTGSAWGALIAGTAWGFWPYHVAHLGHLQLQALYVMPLSFLFLHRLIAGRRRRDAVGLGVMAGLQAIASVYYGVIGAVGLAVSTVLIARGAGGRRTGLLIRRLLLAGVVGLLVVAPVLWPYLQAQQREGFGRNLFEAARHAATVRGYVSVPPENLVYGASGLLPTDGGEETTQFPGVVLVGLAVFGAIVARRQGSRPLALSAYGLIVCGLVLSFGPDGVRPLYAFLQRWVFGFQAIRAPARFAVLVTFGLALLAALGMREIVERRRLAWRGAGRGSAGAADDARAAGAASLRPSLVPLLVLALMVAEYVNRPFAWAEAPARSTAVGRWLKQSPEPGAVLYLPLTMDVGNTPFMVESLEHRRPMVNGYSGQRPSFYSALVDTLHEFPSADAIWTLHDLDVRYVVTEQRITDSQWPLVERARLRDAGAGAAAAPRLIYELVWSPEVEARLGEPVVPEPPPPGPLPFSVGEQASYRVDWQGPAGTVNAGTIVLSVTPGGASAGEASAGSPSTGSPSTGSASAGGPAPGGPAPAGEAVAFRLRVRATTAPWISRFFEADDEFVTDVTSALMPLRHERHLREGRRIADEAYVFDHASRQVRWEEGSSKPPLRFWPGARDPLSAFYYLRTLPLQPGTSLQLPVNDNGRNLGLEVRVHGIERVRVGGREHDALRLTPILRQRVTRRAPPDITVWLSQDERRLPLAADVRAGFGVVRLELQIP